MGEVTNIEIRSGQRKVLRLPGRGTAGYSWGCELDGDPDVVKVTIEPAPVSEIAGKPPGTSTDELITIEARRLGRATIRLTHRRAWEQAGRTLDERTVEVSVVS